VKLSTEQKEYVGQMEQGTQEMSALFLRIQTTTAIATVEINKDEEEINKILYRALLIYDQCAGTQTTEAVSLYPSPFARTQAPHS